MIDSPQNQHVKLFRSLAEGKHRRETGLFALEGRRLVEEALKSGTRLEWAAYSPEKFVGPEADRLLHGLLQAGVELLEITPRALQAMSHTESPPGIAAVARRPLAHPPEAPMPRPPSRGQEGGTDRSWLLGAWEIRDPGNMGTLVRIAHAFGAAAVIAIGNCVDFYDPKVVRASVGSVMWVPLVEVVGLADLRATLAPSPASPPNPLSEAERGEGLTPRPPLLAGQGEWRIVAADMAAEVTCDEAEYPERCVLLVGSEAHGLPEEALEAADLRVSIPMPGGAESLNAAVAAGIVAFQISRKMGK